jgi:glycerophosphoryl diester phosphodiesterase
MVEFDVRSCKDHKTIIFHDDTLDRVHPTLTGPIEKFCWEELQTAPLIEDQYIPSLEETLQTAHIHSLSVNIEIKDSNSTEEVYQIVQRYPNIDITISSFDKTIIEALRQTDNQITLAQLYRHSPTLSDLEKDCKRTTPQAIHVCHQGLTSEWVNAVKKMNFLIRVFTVNSQPLYQKLATYGVDEVFSDYENLLTSPVSTT